MPSRLRPRARPRHRAQTQENVENEDQARLEINNKDPGSSLDLGVVNVLGTSTPVRLPPPPRRGRERKPIQRANVPSTLPPSSPPFATSPLQERRVQDIIEPAEVEDDPFGFFATERRLKQRRDAEQMDQEKRILGNKHEGEEPQEDPEPEFELDLSTFVSGTHTPPGHTPDPRAATPRHHHPRQRKFPSTPTSQEEPFSIPQTPSPMKRVSMGPASVPRRPFADVAYLDNSLVKKSNDDDITTMTKAAKEKGKKRGGKGGSGRARKKHKTEETFAEEELKGMTEELKELLPSRPKRKAAQRKSVVPVAQPTKKSTAKGKGKKKDAKPRSTGKRAKAEEDERESFVLSGEEREQFEVNREMRREYFREVDEYVMDEESVYVI